MAEIQETALDNLFSSSFAYIISLCQGFEVCFFVKNGELNIYKEKL